MFISGISVMHSYILKYLYLRIHPISVPFFSNSISFAINSYESVKIFLKFKYF